jgi:hypothetical protein
MARILDTDFAMNRARASGSACARINAINFKNKFNQK